MENKTELKHTPEPWVIIHQKSNIYIEDAETGFNQVVVFKYGEKDLKDESNAARIVECVNAMAGLTTEQINQVGEWIKQGSTTLVFDYVSKNRQLEVEIENLRNFIRTYHLTSMWETYIQALKVDQPKVIEPNIEDWKPIG